MNWGPTADVRLATRSEAESHWQSPLHAGWKVSDSVHHATRKYGPKTSAKVERTMHEWKRGKLKSSSGKKVTSREQAIAIGLSQARARGYEVPPAPSHALMSIDTRVRAYLSGMRPGSEIDARGIARAIGGVDPLEADYALERAEKAGLAVTSDGRWFGPTGVTRAAHVSHARKKKTPAQLEREIAVAELRNQRDQLLRALGYAGNTSSQVSNYHERIAEIDAKLRALK